MPFDWTVYDAPEIIVTEVTAEEVKMVWLLVVAKVTVPALVFFTTKVMP